MQANGGVDGYAQWRGMNCIGWRNMIESVVGMCREHCLAMESIKYWRRT